MKARTSRLALAALAASLGLAACGGGGGAAPSIPIGSVTTPTQPPTQQNTAKGAISITIPSASSLSSRVNRKFISPSTKSATISLVTSGQSSQIAEADLTPSSNGCAGTSGGTQCTISFVAPSGNDTFLMKLYDQTGGKGNLLGSANVSATLSAAAVTSVPVVLDGSPTAASVVLGASSLPVGNSGTVSLFLQATDADGNIIVGPGSFTSPIALTITGDTYNTLSLSTASVTAPGQAVTLSYTGGTLVGATIAPSGTGLTGTGATFSGTGAALTILPYNAQILDGNVHYFGYPDTIAVKPDGTGAAAVYYMEPNSCCSNAYFYAVGYTTASGSQKLFIGPASPGAAFTGFTSVPGMSASIEPEGYEAYDNLAVDTAGNIYYSARNSSNCYVLGKLNPSAATTAETVLQGEAMYQHFDSAGNLWFIEDNAPCANSAGSGFASGWGVGEVTAGGTLKETDLGINNIDIGDMAISPDGSTMFIAEYYGGTSGDGAIAKINTSTLAVAASLNLTNSIYPEAIAGAPDGSAAWASDNESSSSYYYGTTTSSFSTAYEALFPLDYYYSYSMSYADGSFWTAGDEYNTGYGRLSGVSTGTPSMNFYQLPSPDSDGQELCGIAAANGAIWGADCDYGNIDILQYGAPESTGTMHINVTHRLGAQITTRNQRTMKLERKARTFR